MISVLIMKNAKVDGTGIEQNKIMDFVKLVSKLKKIKEFWKMIMEICYLIVKVNANKKDWDLTTMKIVKQTIVKYAMASWLMNKRQQSFQNCKNLIPIWNQLWIALL